MEIIRINGNSIELDVADELSAYDFDNARWSGDKLISSSPFRDDRAPSFYVNLTGDSAGTWGDSGTGDRGGFVQLIALLRGATYEEAVDYLTDKYGTLYDIKPDEPIRLPSIGLAKGVRKDRLIDADSVTQATSPYLARRGITADVQAIFGVGYGDTERGYTAIPWHTADGRLANIKYRSTSGRGFFYAKDATPISRLVYGIDLAEDNAVLCEGEIDVMSWRVAGISAIAVGGAHLSREQIELIKRSRIKRLYIGGDNDTQGQRLNEQAVKELRGYVDLFTVDYGAHKDANEVLIDGGEESLSSAINNGNRLQTCNIYVK